MQHWEWENKISNQIIVIKKKNNLLETQNCLYPAPKKYPWHIHADGKSEGYSRIRLVAVDYSNKTKKDETAKRTGAGADKKKSVSVYANITPEQVKYLFLQLCMGYEHVEFSSQKFFAEDGTSTGTATLLSIKRETYDKKNQKRELPWIVNIRNGSGLSVRNSNGGTHCKKGTYEEEGNVTVYLDDEEMFSILSRTCAVIHAFEQKQLYRERDAKNFQKLFSLIKKDMDQRMPYRTEKVRAIREAA